MKTIRIKIHSKIYDCINIWTNGLRNVGIYYLLPTHNVTFFNHNLKVAICSGYE